MIAINLFGEKPDNRVRNHLELGGCAACLVGTLVVCMALYQMTETRVKSLEDQKAQIDSRIARLNSEAAEVQTLDEKRKKLSEMTTTLALVKLRKRVPVRVLDEIEKAFPPELWLVQLAESGGRLDLQGYALDEQVVVKAMEGLEASPFLSGVELLFTEQEAIDGVTLKEFSISARIAGTVDPKKAAAGSEEKGGKAPAKRVS